MSALTLTPKSWASWDFTVSDGSRLIADIDVSCWREKGLLTVQGVAHRVYREGATRTFALIEGERIIGAITPNSMWSRDATVLLPEDWPLPLRVFLVWLTIVLWKRDADAGASAAASA